jgi:hypothetical protein
MKCGDAILTNDSTNVDQSEVATLLRQATDSRKAINVKRKDRRKGLKAKATYQRNQLLALKPIMELSKCGNHEVKIAQAEETLPTLLDRIHNLETVVSQVVASPDYASGTAGGQLYSYVSGDAGLQYAGEELHSQLPLRSFEGAGGPDIWADPDQWTPFLGAPIAFEPAMSACDVDYDSFNFELKETDLCDTSMAVSAWIPRAEATPFVPQPADECTIGLSANAYDSPEAINTSRNGTSSGGVCKDDDIVALHLLGGGKCFEVPLLAFVSDSELPTLRAVSSLCRWHSERLAIQFRLWTDIGRWNDIEPLNSV